MMGKKIKAARDRLKEGNFVVPSPAEVAAAARYSTGWTAMQLAEWGVRWPPPMGWRERLRIRWEQMERAKT